MGETIRKAITYSPDDANARMAVSLLNVLGRSQSRFIIDLICDFILDEGIDVDNITQEEILGLLVGRTYHTRIRARAGEVPVPQEMPLSEKKKPKKARRPSASFDDDDDDIDDSLFSQMNSLGNL